MATFGRARTSSSGGPAVPSAELHAFPAKVWIGGRSGFCRRIARASATAGRMNLHALVAAAGRLKRVSGVGLAVLLAGCSASTPEPSTANAGSAGASAGASAGRGGESGGVSAGAGNPGSAGSAGLGVGGGPPAGAGASNLGGSGGALASAGSGGSGGADVPVSGKAYYVSPLGSDTNPGTLSAPFLSIGKARDVVREQNGQMTEDIHVVLRGGTYRLSSAVSFGPADSGSNG